jgi:1-acyl-sn-glycerol-3-phosphate acyltransferase
MALREFHDEGHGYDLFGLSPAAVARIERVLAPLYDRYFRVTSHGAGHLPAAGPAILVGNHSGVLPVDAAMLWLDVLRQTGRALRVVADWFVPILPFVGTWMARAGTVSGSRANVRHLLARGELVAIFPEGVTGMAKPRRERYRLQQWRVGHAELAIRHQAPVIPLAIIGAEESWPAATRLRRVRLFGAPYLPLPASPLPLPVRYHLHYGSPIRFDHEPAAADDPERVAGAADQVRAAVERLVGIGLAARRGLVS